MKITRNSRFAVASIFSINGAVFGIWASRIPAISNSHDLSPASLGFLLFLAAASAITAFSFFGRAADNFGASVITKRASLFNSVILVLIAFAPSFWLLAAALIFFGIIHGGMDVSMNAWAAEVERTNERPLMSSFHAMWSLGAGIGAGSGFLLATYNVDVPMHFAISSIVILVFTLSIVAIPYQVSQKTQHEKKPIYILPKGSLLIVTVIAFCASLSEGAVADWSAIFLISVSSVGDGNAALGYTVFSFCMLVMRLAGDNIVLKFGPSKTARYSGLVAMIGALFLVIFETFTTILIGFGLIGLGIAVIIPLAFSRAANDKTMPQGAAIASVATLGYGGMLIGPLLIGFIAEATSIKTSFLIFPILAFLIFILSKHLSVKSL